MLQSCFHLHVLWITADLNSILILVYTQKDISSKHNLICSLASMAHFKREDEHMSGGTFSTQCGFVSGHKTIGEMVWKTITGHSSCQRTSAVPFIPPHRQRSVPSAYLIPAGEHWSRQGESGQNTNIQGQTPLTLRLLSLYLHHHHIASNPATSASDSETGPKPRSMMQILEIQSYPQQTLTLRVWSDSSVHYSSQHKSDSCETLFPWGTSCGIMPSRGIASIILLTFHMWNWAGSYLWVWSGARGLRGSAGILWVFSPSPSQSEPSDTHCIVGAETLKSDSESQSGMAMKLRLCSQASLWRPTDSAAVGQLNSAYWRDDELKLI